MTQPDAPTDSGEDTVDGEETSVSRRLVSSLLRTAAVGAAVPAGLLISSLVGSHWPAAVLMLAALALLWVAHGSSSQGRIPAPASVAVQFCVIVGVAYQFFGRPDWPIAAVAVLVAGAAVVAELPLTRLSSLHIPFVSNMPGLTPAPRGIGRDRLGRRVRLAALGAGVVGSVAGLPAWVWLLTTVITLIYPTLVLVRGVRRVQARRAIRRSLRGAVAAFSPEFAVYTSRPDAASYQVMMWLPYLRRTGRRFVIVARTNTAAAAIAAGTDDPVITCRDVATLDDLIVPSLRAAFYVNASSGNGAFVRYKQLTHVYLGHGDSDKPPSYNPTHAMYDQIFAAGPAAIERYADHGVAITRDKFRVVGRPQVESVQLGGVGTRPETVLYAPTWRGHVSETMLYSLPVGERIVSALLDRGLTVIFRPHPFSYGFAEDVAAIERIVQLLSDDAARTGRPHRYGAAAEHDLGIIDCINLSDTMVSDVSSVVSDYLFSEKPFAMVAVPCPPEQFVAEYPIARASYVVDGQLTNLPGVLDQLLGADPMRTDRLRMRARYLGDAAAEGYSELFVRTCIETIDRPADVTGEAVDDTIDDGISGPLVERLRAQFAVYGRDAAFAGAALLTVLAAGSGAFKAAAVLALGIIAVIAIGGRRAVRSRVSFDRLLGTTVAARSVLAVALVILWFVESGADWSVGVGASVIVLATVAEVTISSTVTASGTGVANLPEVADPERPRMPTGVLFASNVAVLIMGWLLEIFNGPGVVLLAAAALTLVPLVITSRDGLVRIAAIETARERLLHALAEYRPRFAVYFGSTIGADYQVGMWLPYFRRIGSPFVIITRTMAMLRVIADLDSTIPVLFRPTLRSLEDAVLPTMTTAFYVNNAVRNTHFIERRELTHVWLNHGDSEKPACYNPVHAIYDRLFVAGQAGVDRYARHQVEIPPEKFQIVGRPQVERIQLARGPIASLSDLTVLYAPTWKGPYADTRVYSLPVGERIVGELLRRGIRVIFRAHPFNERYAEDRTAMRAIAKMLDEDRRLTGRAHLWGRAAEEEMSIEDCFNASDAMVADISAVVSDYLKSEKPFSMVAVGQTTEQLLATAPAARAAYVLRDDLANLADVYDVLLGSDPLAEARRASRIYYLGDFPEAHYADGFLDAARDLIGRPAPAPA